jgi:hypothetical protein
LFDPDVEIVEFVILKASLELKEFVVLIIPDDVIFPLVPDI